MSQVHLIEEKRILKNIFVMNSNSLNRRNLIIKDKAKGGKIYKYRNKGKKKDHKKRSQVRVWEWESEGMKEKQQELILKLILER